MDVCETDATPAETLSAATLRRSNDLAACANSGAILLRAGALEAAIKQYELALAIDPSCRQAHAGLYYAFSGLGDMHAAVSHLAGALQLQAVITLPCQSTDSPVSVLLLVSIHAGNVLMQRFLNDRIFQTHIVIVEFYEDWMPLPPHDVVINGIGDADVRAQALSIAEKIIARSSAPVVNSPAAVRETGRCGNAERLVNIPGLITAHTVTLPRARLEGGHASSDLATRGFDFPLLLRAPGFHMGQHFVRVEQSSDLADALSRLPGEDLVVLQFLDGRGEDGFVRKYRVLCIDGRLYPVHAAVSDHWKVHYFSAEMGTHCDRRSEDESFLKDMVGVLGPRTMAALEQIRDRLGLDYGGIDFGLSRKGDVLLFEANATMAVCWPASDARWDYRRPAVERIYLATQQMLMSRAGKRGHIEIRRSTARAAGALSV